MIVQIPILPLIELILDLEMHPNPVFEAGKQAFSLVSVHYFRLKTGDAVVETAVDLGESALLAHSELREVLV